MSVETAVRAGRMAAARQFTDTFAAYSPGAKTTNASGQEVPGFTAQGSTRGKVSGPSAQARDTNTRMVTIGGTQRPVIEGGLHIPLSAAMPSIDWEYQCTSVGPASDPGLLNRRYRVIDVPLKSYATARRLDVVDVTP